MGKGNFRQCTATSKRTHLRCKANAMNGSNVCYHHGGKSLKGIAAPSAKHLRYSKHLPKRLIERYTEAVDDPELMSMRDDIALIDARLADVLKRVDTGEAGILWSAVRSEYRGLRDAIRAKNSELIGAALNELDTLIMRGQADYAAWGEVRAIIEQRSRLIEREQKRLVAMNQILTTEQALAIVIHLAEAVRANVPDQEARSRIQAELSKFLVNVVPGNAPGIGGPYWSADGEHTIRQTQTEATRS